MGMIFEKPLGKSKSLTTIETMTNAITAKDWLLTIPQDLKFGGEDRHLLLVIVLLLELIMLIYIS